MLELLAQVAENVPAGEMNSIVQILNVCALAVMAAAFLWLVIYEMPRQRREEEQARAAERLTAANERRTEREAFQAMLTEERKAFAEATQKQREYGQSLAREGFSAVGKVGEAVTELRVLIEKLVDKD